MSNAARQAAYKARQRAAGMVQVQEWLHREDVPAMRLFARELRKARKVLDKPQNALENWRGA